MGQGQKARKTKDDTELREKRIANLTPGSPGRPKGRRTDKTILATTFAQRMLTDPGFIAGVMAVITNPEHKHWQWTTEVMMHYAWGKPTERRELHTTGDGTAPPMQVAWMDFRQFTQAEQGITLESGVIESDSTPL